MLCIWDTRKMRDKSQPRIITHYRIICWRNRKRRCSCNRSFFYMYLIATENLKTQCWWSDEHVAFVFQNYWLNKMLTWHPFDKLVYRTLPACACVRALCNSAGGQLRELHVCGSTLEQLVAEMYQPWPPKIPSRPPNPSPSPPNPPPDPLVTFSFGQSVNSWPKDKRLLSTPGERAPTRNRRVRVSLISPWVGFNWARRWRLGLLI